MANKKFGEDFLEFNTPPHSDDMFLMLSNDDQKTYKTKRSELFRNVNVEYTVFQFAKNASKSVAPKVGWTEAPPITEDNEWLWIRQGKIAPLSSSIPVWSAPVRIKGEQGASEVYVGNTPPTDGTFQIAIDPDGDLNGGIPSGGKTGEVLTKTTAANYATTWSSPLRPLFIAQGAVFNEVTGFYELNGLKDITESQMCEIYYRSTALLGGNWAGAFYRSTARTAIVKHHLNSTVDASECFRNSGIETLSFSFVISGQNLSPAFTNGHIMFYGCGKLARIEGFINCSSLTNTTSMFLGSAAIQQANMRGLRINLSFADSPLLTRDSIIYLITNAANTTPITVTLHAQAKVRLTEADIALASSKNITIA